MLLIIFGAGGSFDSDPRPSPRQPVTNYWEDARPPLASQLFDDRFNKHLRGEGLAARELIPRLRRAAASKSGPAVEEELRRIEEEGHPGRARALLGMRYYLQAVVRDTCTEWRSYNAGVTNYLDLLHSANAWRHEHTGERVALVTFNYDTMIDEAASDVLHRPIETVGSFVADPGFMLFKVHGSTSWLRAVRGVPRIEDEPLDHADELEWTTHYFSYSEQGARERDMRLVPAIAVPAASKHAFEMSPDRSRKPSGARHTNARTESAPGAATISRSVRWRQTTSPRGPRAARRMQPTAR